MDDEYVYNFRLIKQKDNSELIDDKLKTPISSLTPSMQMEYDKVEYSLFMRERLIKKELRKQEEKEKQQNKIIYKIMRFLKCIKNIL